MVDGGGLLHRTLIGDAIAELAIQNGWAGVVINGAIRDSMIIEFDADWPQGAGYQSAPLC